MTIRLLVAAGLSATLSSTFAAPAASAHPLTIVVRDMALAEALQQVALGPFAAKAGVTAEFETWDGEYAALQREVASGAPGWDLIAAGAEIVTPGCDDGLLAKIDWPAIGGRDHYLAQGTSDCGVGAVVHNLVLGWDRDKFPGMPGWGDFWDVAKYPGKRGLRRGARLNLEIALMADGVAPGDVYRTLRSDDGVDRAFRKLDQIKPYVVWWRTNEQASKLLETGDVLLTAVPNTRVAALAALEGRRFGMQWTNSLSTVEFWAIPVGAPNAADATKLLAALGDPAAEARLTALVPFGGLARGATAGLTPEQLAQAPNNPANIAASLQVDDQFWRDNQARLNQRFETWLDL